MKGKALDLKGKRIGIITVIKRVENDGHGQAVWLCKCDCGKEFTRRASEIKRGGQRTSCGCLRGVWSITHGGSRKSENTRIYSCWKDIKSRCYSSKNKYYYLYGGRGIKMCDDWLGDKGFVSFKEWALSHGYSDDLTIDRIDVNGDYEPSNCRWATPLEQGNNKRTCHYIEFNGISKTISEWSRETGIPMQTIHERIDNMGWSIEKALTSPVHKSKNNATTFVIDNRDENGLNDNNIIVLKEFLKAYEKPTLNERILSGERLVALTGLTTGKVNMSRNVLKKKGVVVRFYNKDHDKTITNHGFILTDNKEIQDKFRHYLDNSQIN